MKSKWLIEQRLLHDEQIDPVSAAALRWVLESPECPLCNMADRRDLELDIFKDKVTPAYIEAKHGWPAGIVEEHISHHLDYDPKEAREIEYLRSESITTLDMASDIFGRIQTWLDEWEREKDAEGISREWITEATKLVSQANSSLKLIGQLKKEIGVDSQLLLAQQRVDGVMGVIVDVLRDRPELLNAMEIRLASLRAPSNVYDAEFVIDDE